jgi:hypothetical protein
MIIVLILREKEIDLTDVIDDSYRCWFGEKKPPRLAPGGLFVAVLT